MTKRIVLVGCGKAKADSARPARDLYTGNLFRAARAYAEAEIVAGRAQGWAVLSAKHGLVMPDVELEPYDERLTKRTAAAWTKKLAAQFAALGPSLDERIELEVLAGVDYLEPLHLALPALWTTWEPLGRMEIGERLAWFKANTLDHPERYAAAQGEVDAWLKPRFKAAAKRQSEGQAKARARQAAKKVDPAKAIRAAQAEAALEAACPSCGARVGHPCKNYKGQRKATCPGRYYETEKGAEELAASRAAAPLSPAEAAELIAGAPEQRKNAHGFTRIDPKPWGKLRAVWVHPSGWRLEHCGHPTALHPWALYNPAGEMICTGAKLAGDPLRGTAWWSLDEAQAWAAGESAKATPVRPMSADLAMACEARELGRSADQLEAAIVGQSELPALSDARHVGRCHDPLALAFLTGKPAPENDPALVQLTLFA